MSEMRVWAVYYDNSVWDSLSVHLPWGNYSWPSKPGLSSALSQRALGLLLGSYLVSLCLPLAPFTHSDTHVIHMSTGMTSRGQSWGGVEMGAKMAPCFLGLLICV